MNFLIFSTFIIIYCSAVIFASQNVPVLLWSSSLDVQPVPGLRHLGTSEFLQLLQDGTTSKPNIVVFLKDELSVENFWVTTPNEKPVYDSLSHKLASIDSEFLPSVAHPMKSIHHLKESGYNIIHYSNKIPKSLKTPTVLLVSVDSKGYADNESIVTIYEKFELLYSNTLAIYTGRRDAWLETQKIANRVRRAVKEGDDYEGVVIVVDQFAVIANSITFYPDKDSPKNLSAVESSEMKNVTDSSTLALDVTFAGQTEKFSFIFNSDAPSAWQWFLRGISVNDNTTLKPPEGIWAPKDWSYYCGKIAFKGTADYPRIEFLGFQVQPNVVNGEFGDPIDCVPYFSMAIWSGILITALLLSIVAWGLMMIMDINNNDRFDDPKGKTITISSTD